MKGRRKLFVSTSFIYIDIYDACKALCDDLIGLD